MKTQVENTTAKQVNNVVVNAYSVNAEILENPMKTPAQLLLKEVLAVYNTLTAINPTAEALPKNKPNVKLGKTKLGTMYAEMCAAYTVFVKSNPGCVVEPQPKKEPKAKKEKAATGTKRPDAQTRLTMYTAELEQKTAYVATEEYKVLSKPEAKAIRKRIASLNRKIARANKALGLVPVAEMHPALQTYNPGVVVAETTPETVETTALIPVQA